MPRNAPMAALVIAVVCGAASAQTLQIGPDIVTRDDALKATLKLPRPLTGPGELKLTWTDSYGRTVAVQTRKVQLNGAEAPITLPLARAVAMQNFLAA